MFLIEVTADQLLQQAVNGVSKGAVYALIAVGYTMVYGVLQLINFAHGEVYMLGAYFAYYPAKWAGYIPEEGGEKPKVPILLIGAFIFMSMAADNHGKGLAIPGFRGFNSTPSRRRSAM